MHLFGRGKPKTTPKDAIIRLRETLDMLEKRERYLQTKIDNELKTAKANATNNKRAALMALKRKKMYETQIEKISGARMTIETQMGTIENANVNLEAMKAMKMGADAMKEIHGAMDINKVDQTMDEIRDQMDLANEISDAISQPVGMGMDMDEDELNAELELLEQEELDSKLLGLENVPISAPNVPTTEPAVAQPPRPTKGQVIDEDEEAELAMLKASMAVTHPRRSITGTSPKLGRAEFSARREMWQSRTSGSGSVEKPAPPVFVSAPNEEAVVIAPAAAAPAIVVTTEEQTTSAGAPARRSHRATLGAPTPARSSQEPANEEDDDDDKSKTPVLRRSSRLSAKTSSLGSASSSSRPASPADRLSPIPSKRSRASRSRSRSPNRAAAASAAAPATPPRPTSRLSISSTTSTSSTAKPVSPPLASAPSVRVRIEHLTASASKPTAVASTPIVLATGAKRSSSAIARKFESATTDPAPRPAKRFKLTPAGSPTRPKQGRRSVTSLAARFESAPNPNPSSPSQPLSTPPPPPPPRLVVPALGDDASAFAHAGSVPCTSCGGAVYRAEAAVVGARVWHAGCLVCGDCRAATAAGAMPARLAVGGVVVVGGVAYCASHGARREVAGGQTPRK
ncbi:ESCRT-III subunit protein snf7 [Blastocladiella emersonii ATCC 22665]|nr:ESCRT-III subunit protein snf7 [Blastocladiella emersonii ATCC 22665]